MDNRLDVDDAVFLQVANEIRAGFKDEALWTKAFAMEDGDVNKTKATYIKLRVQQLVLKKEREPDFRTVETSESETRQAPEPVQRSSFPIIRVLIGAFLVLLVIFVIQSKQSTVQETLKQTAKPQQPAPVAQPKLNTEVPPWELAAAGLDYSDGTPISANIYLSGEITQNQADTLSRLIDSSLVKNNGKLVLAVVLDSKGGDLYAAMAIGRKLRQRGDVAVVVPNDAECYSACVFIFAAGMTRHASGKVGIHRPFKMDPSSDPVANAKWFDKVSVDARAYLREMRVRESLYDDMVAIPPSRIRIFDGQHELNQYGLIQLDPIQEEINVARIMEKNGIKDRSVFNQRYERIHALCRDIKGEEFNTCFQQVMQGNK